MNFSEVIGNLRRECGIELEDDLFIGWENDEEGRVIRILVYVNNLETANVVTGVLTEAMSDEKQGCQYGVLCRAKTIRLETVRQAGSVRRKRTLCFILLAIELMAMLFQA